MVTQHYLAALLEEIKSLKTIKNFSITETGEESTEGVNALAPRLS